MTISWPGKMIVVACASAFCLPQAYSHVPAASQRTDGLIGPPAPDQSDELLSRVPEGIPSDLASAVDQMLATYPSIGSRRQSVRAADSEVRAAEWLQYPSVSVDALSFAGGSQFAANNIGVNLTVEQPIWNNGVVGATIERAKSARSASEWQLQETAYDLALSVAQVYFDMVRTARRNGVLREGRSSLSELAQTIDRRVEQQVSPATDGVLVQARVAQLDQEIALNEAQYYSARERYRQLTGVPAAELREVPEYDPALAHPSVEGAFEEALQCDPKRQRLIAERNAARNEAKIAQSRLFPQLAAQFSANEITGNRIGFVLRAQTTGGLSGFSAANAAQYRGEASALLVDVHQREAREQLSQDFVENISAGERTQSNEAAAAAAASVTESYRRQFVAGRRTWLDVVNAVREATQADLARVDTEVTAQASAARILLRTCRWTTRVVP